MLRFALRPDELSEYRATVQFRSRYSDRELLADEGDADGDK